MAKSKRRQSTPKSKSPKVAKYESDEEVDKSEAEEGKGGSGGGGEEAYVVEAVVDKRRRNNRVEYLIKWQGYGDQDNTWEPEANLDCQELIDEYEKSVKSSAQKPSKASTVTAKKSRPARGGGESSIRDVIGFERGFEAEKIIGVTELIIACNPVPHRHHNIEVMWPTPREPESNEINPNSTHIVVSNNTLNVPNLHSNNTVAANNGTTNSSVFPAPVPTLSDDY
ncbi:unnamed protein product [Oppiella nova]|uniref:Chromo domain-containing protein n=1 Tax=Oppiella nova TaxID=334625 RepID=A0A7R9QMX1_9ACAR|nr:unnamed protein product [Oppiella nova]CAG2168771.1 unnamed protein product [Oppiella nova]